VPLLSPLRAVLGSLDNSTENGPDQLTHLLHTSFCLCHQQFARICLRLLLPLLRLSSFLRCSAIVVTSYRSHPIKFRKFRLDYVDLSEHCDMMDDITEDRFEARADFRRQNTF